MIIGKKIGKFSQVNTGKPHESENILSINQPASKGI